MPWDPALSGRSLADPLGALGAPLPGLPGLLRRAALRALILGLGPLVTIEGAERLRDIPEPAVFVFNHGNSLEAVLAPAALIYLRGRPLHMLADWMLLYLPAVGALLRLADPIPVYGKRARWRLFEAHRRERVKAEVIDACLARLAAGASVGLFPEGTRNPDPLRLLPARRGLGELALRSPAPIVPVGLRYPAAQRLGRVPRVGRMVLAVGFPVDLAPERWLACVLGSGPGERAERRALARRAAARIMARLAELCGKRVPEQSTTPPQDGGPDPAARGRQLARGEKPCAAA